MLIFDLEIRKLCTRFPKLTTVPLYEMKCGIVRYDHLTSFETLAHTFPMFLPSQLSAWSSQGFLKNAMANFFQHFQKNRGHNYTVWWLLNPESCWRLLVCNQWKFYIRPTKCHVPSFTNLYVMFFAEKMNVSTSPCVRWKFQPCNITSLKEFLL